MTRHAPLGVAVIGTGRMGPDHVHRITQVISGARVSAVADIDAERAKGLADGIEGCTRVHGPGHGSHGRGLRQLPLRVPGTGRGRLRERHGRIGEDHGMLVNSAGRWGGSIARDFVERFTDAYDREVQACVDATLRGEVTGPGCWDGYAAAAVCEAGVRARTEGGRTEVDLIERPALYR
jgi:predicted dehydrogenase